MFLLILSSFRVLVLEDEVDLGSQSADIRWPIARVPYLVRSPTLVRTKHDDIGRRVGKFVSV